MLVRSSARNEALSSLARQASLIATQQRAAPASATKLTSLGAFFDTQQERLAILSLPQAALLLPPDGGDALRADRPAQGSVVVGGQRYLYAAHPERKQAVVLLRPAKLASSDLRPFTIAFGIAAAVGRRDRRDRRLLARPRRLAADRAGLRREPRPRRRGAPRPAARGRLDRGGRTRRVVQPARRRPRPREGRRALIPALGQPRAEDPARRDPRPRRGADRRRDDRAEGRRR